MHSEDNTKRANAHVPICPLGSCATNCGPDNGPWLVEYMLPLGRVEVGWAPDEPIELDYDLVGLGLEVAYSVGQPRWRDQQVMTQGAAVLVFGDEHVIEGAGRLIVFDPQRPKPVTSEANCKLFEYDVYGQCSASGPVLRI